MNGLISTALVYVLMVVFVTVMVFIVKDSVPVQELIGNFEEITSVLKEVK